MTFEVNKHVGQFSRNLGNGAAALADVAVALEHVRTNRDTTVLVRMIERAKEKQDAAAASATMFLVRQVFEGAKAGKTKDGRMTIKIKDAVVSNTAPATIDRLVSEGTSLRGPKVREAFKSDDEKQKDFDVKAWAARAAKAHPDQINAMIAALQEARKSVK